MRIRVGRPEIGVKAIPCQGFRMCLPVRVFRNSSQRTCGYDMDVEFSNRRNFHAQPDTRCMMYLPNSSRKQEEFQWSNVIIPTGLNGCRGLGIELGSVCLPRRVADPPQNAIRGEGGGGGVPN